MARKREVMYVCDSCGYDSAKWYGQCPNCREWNTMREARGVSLPSPNSSKKSSLSHVKSRKIGDVADEKLSRISTGFGEFDRVLGGASVGESGPFGAKALEGKQGTGDSGDKRDRKSEQEHKHRGIVPGEVVLLSGDPGVGKSTLLLQVALCLADSKAHVAGGNKSKTGKNKKKTATRVLYITGEESASQVKMRAERIVRDASLSEFDLHILSTVDTDAAIQAIEKLSPGLVIVDSIQTIASESLSGFAGSVPQIRYATSQLVTLAKALSIPIFMIGHVTKEGIVAGPQLLSHMVDAVLYLEGEQSTGTRILRAYKNRFGDTSEVGIFLMEQIGLVELFDASSFFMDKRDAAVPGSCLTVVMEGSRPILVEIQALSVPSTLAFPRRVSNGVESKRLELLLAVLQKHLNLRVDKLDIFVNVVGGLTVREVAIDLAVCLAIASSVQGKALDFTCAIAEVGLLGELKSVTGEELRAREAKRLGVKQIVTPGKKHFLRDIIQSVL